MGIFYNAIRAQILLLTVTTLGALMLCSDETKQLKCPNYVVSIIKLIDPAITQQLLNSHLLQYLRTQDDAVLRIFVFLGQGLLASLVLAFIWQVISNIFSMIFSTIKIFIVLGIGIFVFSYMTGSTNFDANFKEKLKNEFYQHAGKIYEFLKQFM